MRKRKKKSFIKKKILLIFLFALIANFNIWAVDIAPRISDKEIVQALADIKSEFKLVHSELKLINKNTDLKINALRAELKAEMNGNKKELLAIIDGNKKELLTLITANKKELLAIINGNKRELQANINGLSAKFDLVLYIAIGILGGVIAIILALVAHHFKILIPLLNDYKELKERFDSFDGQQALIALKELASKDKKVKDVLVGLHLL